MKKALLVGIDDYPGAPLQGCVADATQMAELLRRHEDGSLNFEPRLLTSAGGEVSREALREALEELFANSRDNELLFYFSGHGAITRWGTELVTMDFGPHSYGVDMDDVLTLASNSPARDIVIVFDCCYSGAMGDARAIQDASAHPEHRFGRALLRENVTLMAAASSGGPAAELAGQGVFTRLLIEGLEGAAAEHDGSVTALSLYGFASKAFGGWDQRPVLKANITQPSALRRCKPAIEDELLRRLPDYFDAANTEVRMSPDYEGEGRPLPEGTMGTDEQQAFDYFKRLRNAGLLATLDQDDLYFAAVESGRVSLTLPGRYFWRLAKEGRL